MAEWRDDARASRYVVIGPTGWIGRAALAWLFQTLGTRWSSQVSCFGSYRRLETGPDGEPLAVNDLMELKPHDVNNAIVFHLAYLTKDKTADLSESEFFAANLGIDQTVLQAISESDPRALFVASSGAARDAVTGASRNLYGITKLLQEDRFESFGKASGVSTMIGRIFNIAGPYINKYQLYAISSFALQALTGRSIRIDAGIPVFRSYLHVQNLVELVVAELLRGSPSPTAIDLCGAEVLEMAEIAKAVARESGLPDKSISRPELDTTRDSSYLGDPRPALTLALKHKIELRSFQTQVAETVAFVAKNLTP